MTATALSWHPVTGDHVTWTWAPEVVARVTAVDPLHRTADIEYERDGRRVRQVDVFVRDLRPAPVPEVRSCG